jgi:hypothetical protein
MVVVYDSMGMRDPDAQCAVCAKILGKDGGYYGYPYVEWTTAAELDRALCICGECVLNIENGFMADMIHLAASMRLRKLPHQLWVMRREKAGPPNRGKPYLTHAEMIEEIKKTKK